MNRFNRSNPGPGKVQRIPNRGCVSYSAGSGKVVERVKAVRAKSVSFGESDSMQNERVQRHFEAVRATLQNAGDDAPGAGYGTLQPQMQRNKYRDSDFVAAITKDLQIKESKPNGHYHKDVCPPTSFEMYCTDFNETCSTKKLPDGIARQRVDVSGNQVLEVAYARQRSTDEAINLQCRTGILPHCHSNNKQHGSRTGRFPRPATAHELNFASTANDMNVAYVHGTLPSKHRSSRPVTTHECTFADYYSESNSERSMSYHGQNNPSRDFNALQKQGAQVRLATIPHGYRTTSYRMAMTGQKHNKVLRDATKSNYEIISEAGHSNVSEKQASRNVVSSAHPTKSRLTKNDDYVSMDNLHATTSARAAKQGLAADVHSLAIDKDSREGEYAPRTINIDYSKKSVSVPTSGSKKTPLKGILKNPTKHTEVKSKSGVSTLGAKQTPHLISSTSGDGNVPTVEKNGIFLTSFPVSPDKPVTKKISSKEEVFNLKTAGSNNVLHHKALIHHSGDELSQTAKAECHGNSDTNRSLKKILSEKTGTSAGAHDRCSETGNQVSRSDSKPGHSCLDLKKPIWPAPPPPLQGALTSYTSFESHENETTLTRSHKRRAPPVPTKNIPSEGTGNCNSTGSQQTKQHGGNVTIAPTSTVQENKKEQRGPPEQNGQLIEYLRQIARSGMNVSSDVSPDSNGKNSGAGATNPDYVNYDWYNQYYHSNHGSNNLNASYSEDDYFSDDDEFDDDFDGDDSDHDETDFHER